MTNMVVPAGARSISVEAVLIRCVCGAPETHPRSACPEGTATRLKGAYWHKNPLRRAWFWLTGRMT